MTKLQVLLGGVAGSIILAGCAQQSSPVVPPNGVTPATVERGSWMSPAAKHSDLLYVSDIYESAVLAFSYPAGTLVGTISGISEAQGECTSPKSHGNWWVVATGTNTLYEYAHGGTTPLATINVSYGQPAACAVNPKSGSVAVTLVSTDDVVIYQNGSGGGTKYPSPISPFFCAYDAHGNLWVDGSGPVSLVELPKDGNTFEQISLNQTIVFPGNVLWHDKLIDVGDQETATLYRFAISGSSGSLQGSTAIDGGGAGGFWIQMHTVIAPESGNVGFWKYPAGGEPTKTITGYFEEPADTIVSTAK